VQAARQAFPEFRAFAPEMAGHAAATVVSIMLDGCHGCVVQEHAISAENKDLLERNVNVLLVNVSHDK